MKVHFHPEAHEEFLSAVDYYEGCSTGLGFDFASEVRSAIESSSSFPNAWPALAGDLRRTLIRRFPYGIVYSVEDNAIFILAVMHLHRAPEYWKHRR